MRLDFAWGEALSDATKSEIEEVTNLAIRSDLAVSAQFMSLPEAREWGALALFGETYDEAVRVVQVGGPWSRELCGGTHVSRSSQIGMVSLTGESSVGSGVRRLEAEVGIDALRVLLAERAVIRRLTSELKTPVSELESRVLESIESLKQAQKQLEDLKLRQGLSKVREMLKSSEEIGGCKVIAQEVQTDSSEILRQLVMSTRDQLGESAVIILGSVIDGKPVVMVGVGKAAQKSGSNAGVMAKKAAEVLGGGGGGKPDFAQGGGVDSGKLRHAIQAAKGLIS
jgi:alanyl-tRNA synthetase